MAFDALALFFLFALLGWSADIAVRNIRYLGSVLKIRLFAFGVLLGLVTTLPELSLGVNATIDRAAALSVGNLLGGVIVMLGLILGASLVLKNKIKTDGRLASAIPAALVIFSPVIFGMDGKYGLADGLAMVGLYIGLLFYLYRMNHFQQPLYISIGYENKITKSVLAAIVGIIGVLLASHWIVQITLNLLQYVRVSQLMIGLLMFSVGTNLPEISIAVASWRKKSSELSLSHLLSSSFTNVLVLGILALLRPIPFEANIEYWNVAVFLAAILAFFAYFYHSGKKMDRREGAILLAIYIAFVATSLVFAGGKLP